MKSEENMEDLEIMENKNVAGNGGFPPVSLEFPGSTEETEPLRKRPPPPIPMKPLPRKTFDEEEGSKPGRPSDLDEEDDDFFTTCANKWRLTPKKGIIYVTVCSIIIIFLLVILILMTAFWPTDNSRDVCQTAECHLTSGKILSYSDMSSEPCEDFWKFSCGGWHNSNPIPKSLGFWSNDLMQQLNIKEKIRIIINTQIDKATPYSVDRKIKEFYGSCIDTHYIESFADNTLKKFINQFGGWEALGNFGNFHINDFNFNRVFRDLHKTFRISPYFRIEVVPDPQIPTKHIIKISPAGLSLPDKTYYKNSGNHTVDAAFKHYVQDVLHSLGVNNYQAGISANNIFSYEGRIAERTPEEANFTKVRLDSVKSVSSSIFWEPLLSSMFPQAKITPDTEVLINMEYAKHISEIVSTSDISTLNNYLIWHLTSASLPYLSNKFYNAHEDLRKKMTGSQENTPRWEFCIDETLKYFLRPINAKLSANCHRRKEKIEKVNSMFNDIKTSLRNRIQESTRFDETLRVWAQDKLKLMTIQVGEDLKQSELLTELYYPFPVQSDIFENVKSAVDFQLGQQQKYLSGLSKVQISGEPFKIEYNPTTNKIHFPETKLQDDLLLTNSLPLLYGSIGVEFAETIAKSFGFKSGMYLNDGSLMRPGDHKLEEGVNLIEQKRSCLASFFLNIKLDDDNYIQRTSLDTTYHLAGIEIALDTLKSILPDSTTTLPSLEYKPTALFFISYGQSQCSSQTEVFHSMEHSIFKSLDHEHRVRGVLRQLGEFTDAFGCAKTTEMYADFRCGYVL